YFAKPVVLTGKKIAPSEMAVLEILNLLNTDADNSVIESTIKQHISLGLNLLRLVNTPAVGCVQRIGSLSQALMILGRRHLQRWLQILLYAKPGKDGVCSQALLTLASTRGKLLELIANKLYPNQRLIADTAFTVGIMSLMDSLFGVPMQEILQQLHVVDEVSVALLERSGMYGQWLKLAESIEHIDDSCPVMASLLEQLQLSPADFYLLELDAFDWANSVALQAA
ncbi:MAG: HDOD domain-containing protein, partial [Burkholderiales bacterium]|nr:HDOD domain-containing protein [Burkholderiales bacterium]